jgi:predicted Zn finger-like uncharacterized protein
MSLVTRCPRCRTLFRVTPVQLQQRSGTVRCGRCMETFDGFEALAVEQSPASEPLRLESNAGTDAREMQAPAAANVSAGTQPRVTSAAMKPTVSHQHREPRDGIPAAPLARAPRRPAIEEPALRALPAVRSFWGAGALVLALLLLLQAAYVYRSELAGRFPAMRVAFTGICELTGCTVTLPQRPDLVKIEASDVHVTDVTRPGLIQLTATLRSYANYDLAYPALDLVLTNTNEHALARRIFVPDEYLDQTRDPKRGISPNAEITVALDLDTSDLNAAGFRLDLLPAPAP